MHVQKAGKRTLNVTKTADIKAYDHSAGIYQAARTITSLLRMHYLHVFTSCKSGSMQLSTLAAHKFFWDWLRVRHALTASMKPQATFITLDHPLTIIYMSATGAADNPVLISSCKA